jgi:hypothetical protein
MTLIEYLRMRRQVEEAPSGIIAQAEELAEEVKALKLTTLDEMWRALMAKAEER